MESHKLVEKSSFKLYITNDSRVLIEHPLRVDGSGKEPTLMLVISENIIQVQGTAYKAYFLVKLLIQQRENINAKAIEDKKHAFPQSTGSIAATHEVMGILGILHLNYGNSMLIGRQP